ncbi:MAG: DUF1700 domain-containing protein, partial [Bacilli bacterium]|nr:DUF1700 domain-containing protein [Bacilli bacterium]
MNKEEFLNKLRKKLSVLEDSEIEDIISEYRGYIEEKVNVGLTEEEATKELGDIDEIARDLLAAYKVKSEPEEGTFSKFINKLSVGLDNFMESLNDKSAKDIIKVLIEIVIILFLICLLKIPFAMIRDLGSNIFEELVNPVGSVFSGLWRFIIELSYVIVAILFFFKMFEQRYFRDVSEKIVEEHETYVKEESKPKKSKTTSSAEKTKPAKVIVKEKDNSFVNVLSTICIYILKFLVIFFLIGVVFYLVGMSIAIGFAIYFLIKGVTYYGILILLVALFLGGAFILELGLNFIFNKKIKSYHVFGKLISCIII